MVHTRNRMRRAMTKIKSQKTRIPMETRKQMTTRTMQIKLWKILMKIVARIRKTNSKLIHKMTQRNHTVKILKKLINHHKTMEKPKITTIMNNVLHNTLDKMIMDHILLKNHRTPDKIIMDKVLIMNHKSQDKIIIIITLKILRDHQSQDKDLMDNILIMDHKSQDKIIMDNTLLMDHKSQGKDPMENFLIMDHRSQDMIIRNSRAPDIIMNKNMGLHKKLDQFHKL